MAAKLKTHETIPPVGEDDAFIGIAGVRILTSKGTTAIYEGVRAKTFPAPVVRGPRFTRWRCGDIRQWLRDQANQAEGTQ